MALLLFVCSGVLYFGADERCISVLWQAPQRASEYRQRADLLLCGSHSCPDLAGVLSHLARRNFTSRHRIEMHLLTRSNLTFRNELLQ
jgi:hypothetical protein